MTDRRPSHVLAEERSLAMHGAVAARLVSNPALLERARSRVAAWRKTGSVHSSYVDAWEALLCAGLDAVRGMLEERSERAHDLRQVSPFAGVLDARERWRIRRDVAERSKAS